MARHQWGRDAELDDQVLDAIEDLDEDEDEGEEGEEDEEDEEEELDFTREGGGMRVWDEEDED